MPVQIEEMKSRAGLIAVVGRANVGKSSLVNAILEEKVSIVSPVAQTTRNVIRGILTEPRGQLVFLDTPGMHKAVGDLGRVMNRLARSATEGVDIVLLVLDGAAPPREEDEGWISRLVRADVPCVAVLNKSDLGNAFEEAYRKLWADAVAAKDGRRRATPLQPVGGNDVVGASLAKPDSASEQMVQWLGASATAGDHVAELVNDLFELAPEGPLLFPEDVLTDFPRKLNMADIIREKLFLELRDELPHAIAVWIESINEQETSWTVSAVIYVNKSSQKGIVIGEKGRLLRKVRRAAEAELAAMYDRPVKLDLWVKVEKNWSRNIWMLKKLGYVQ